MAYQLDFLLQFFPIFGMQDYFRGQYPRAEQQTLPGRFNRTR
jgi:hypothetical protein